MAAASGEIVLQEIVIARLKQAQEKARIDQTNLYAAVVPVAPVEPPSEALSVEKVTKCLVQLKNDGKLNFSSFKCFTESEAAILNDYFEEIHRGINSVAGDADEAAARSKLTPWEYKRLELYEEAITALKPWPAFIRCLCGFDYYAPKSSLSGETHSSRPGSATVARVATGAAAGAAATAQTPLLGVPK